MSPGDKVRFKGIDPLIPRGSIGVLTNIDWMNDTITVKFDNFTAHFTPTEFKELVELIIDVKAPCPVVLRSWYIATEPYMRRFDK